MYTSYFRIDIKSYHHERNNRSYQYKLIYILRLYSSSNKIREIIAATEHLHCTWLIDSYIAVVSIVAKIIIMKVKQNIWQNGVNNERGEGSSKKLWQKRVVWRSMKIYYRRNPTWARQI